jgi:hypothetical protein
MEILILSLLVLAGIGAWCVLSTPDEAHDKVVNDVQ